MKDSIFYRTAESVSPRHPDKLCDQISDAILDAHLRADPNSRVAVETCGGHGEVFIVGEVTSTAKIENSELETIAHRIAGKNLNIRLNLVQQSPEIAGGVDTGGAGDQGIMIGYACAETEKMLPLEVVLARELNKYIYEKHPFDGKTQVTLKDENGHTEIASIVASFQNTPKETLKTLVKEFLTHNSIISQITENVNILAKKSLPELHLNPAGDWAQGGFDADTGLTGRKLIVDNYGPRIPIGGGAFSGKDPSKVDRSAAYMARKIAVDYLKSRAAKEVFVRLAYAIGYAEPLEATVIIDGKPEQIPNKSPLAQPLDAAPQPKPEQTPNVAPESPAYDLTPRGIIASLDLKRPIYEPTARYGHFGEGFDWDN